MKVIVAIDSFKGCMTSIEANEAAAEGIRDVLPTAEIEKVAVSDGGEGWIEAFVDAKGGEIVEIDVCDPLMRPLKSKYAACGDVAVIETAKASGIGLLKKDELNPLKTSTYGTGQLINDAIKNGCKKFIVGLGGSATSDCGIGMLTAIADCFSEGDIYRLPKFAEVRDLKFTIATDVNNPLYGIDGAAHVFAPQKGATPETVRILDDRAKDFAAKNREKFGYDHSHNPGAGAAGGLGYAFMQFLGAERCSGADLLLDAADFDNNLRDADLVITGEGSADRQTLLGKLPFVILKHATRFGVPVALFAGRIADVDELRNAGFRFVECINPERISLESAIRKNVAMENLRRAVRKKMDE